MDLEDVNDEVREALITSEFRTKLSEVYYRKRVEVELQNVSLEAIYVSAKWNNQTFPSVELVGDISRNNSEEGSPIDLTHEIMLFYHNRGDDEETVHRTVTRFLTAVREYFTEHPVLARISGTVVVGDDNHSPFVAEGMYDGRPFIKSGTIQVYVRTIS